MPHVRPFLLVSLAARALACALLDTLSPPACAACDAPVRRDRVFCSPCAASVHRTANEPGAPLAFAAYGGAVAAALRRFKYGERPDLGRPLGHLLRGLVREEAPEVDLVVPVPLHPRKLAERGYNQAALLAHAAADELDVPLAARALLRLRDTTQQAALGRAERHTNVARAFVARSPRAVQGRRVLLVDDVATTGATLSACRDALVEAGARDVITSCVARAGDG
ncbi:ComF family protein [Polyangium sorediatum]|uniref:Phosphoribosyltransferase family protein n=1 Tax=Polyangium sorediatum TaxID=889274 RepID=A0ABT6NRR2_9BACT|nr:phosphoribosyltransferase family protein [Polyangium sorediatum]MDI1431010.1 phosphoribosyltransferase family protein [Polyangium sorediatum]